MKLKTFVHVSTLAVTFGLAQAKEPIWQDSFDDPSSGKSNVTLVDGKTGKAASFVANTDRANYPIKGKFKISSGTIELWIRPNWNGTDRKDRTILDILGTPAWWNRFALRTTSAGQLMFDIVKAPETIPEGGAGDCFIITPIDGWKKGEWHHIAIMWENINSRENDTVTSLYVDGKHCGSWKGDIIISEIGEDIVLGNCTPSDGLQPLPFNGAIDEIKIYDYAKTAGEIGL